MDMPRLKHLAAALAIACVTSACTTTERATTTAPPPAPTVVALDATPPEAIDERTTVHRGDDDLLTAGLGLDGLRAMAPPAYADPDAPTPDEVRRRATWSNWRGIADLMPGSGFGTLHGSFGPIEGREFSALLMAPGARHPHRVLVQVPDAFDHARPCLVVAPASGSRGVLGAIAVAGAWGLPRGCAVAYTDKGAGTDYFDLDAGLGVREDGTIGAPDDGLAFVPEASPDATGVAVKHAHSRENPEAAWGEHVRQAALHGLRVLSDAFPDAAPFTAADTRVIAVGISNGGGAVLRAAETPDTLFDAVVAGEPNVHVDGHGGRALYDYATEAALLMPCARLDLPDAPSSPLTGAGKALGTLRCASLAAAGLVQGDDHAAQARDAHARMTASGWTDAALTAGALSVDFDLWRAIAATYASAYGRFGAGEHPCGYGFAALDANQAPRPATPAERAAWPADASGIPPGAGVGIVDTRMAMPDPVLPGVQCLRALFVDDTQAATRVRAGIAELEATPPRPGLPVVVVHGLDDGLVPAAFTSAPYVAMARAAGRDVRHWQVRNAQHFDAFLGLPDFAARYVPLLPYVHAALDRVDAHLDGAGPLPGDALIDSTPRAAGTALTAEHLAIPD